MTDPNHMPKSNKDHDETMDAAEESSAASHVSDIDNITDLEDVAPMRVEESDGFANDPVLAELVRERDQFKEIAQRLQAEFENFKKRTAKSDFDRLARAEEQLVFSLLPVLDAMELAVVHNANDESTKQIQSQLCDVLTKAGLTSIGAEGEGFDPNLHEAVMHEAGEGEPSILEVFRTGYQWKGRVIRPAMVKVSGS